MTETSCPPRHQCPSSGSGQTKKIKNKDWEQFPQSNFCFRFVEGERVLCFHGPLIYEAKINKVKEVKVKAANAGEGAAATVVKYFIHYHGWNKNWDEWVRMCVCFGKNDGKK